MLQASCLSLAANPRPKNLKAGRSCLNYSALRIHDTRQKYLRFAWSYAISFWTTAFGCFKICPRGHVMRANQRSFGSFLKPCLNKHVFFRLSIRSGLYIISNLAGLTGLLLSTAWDGPDIVSRCGAARPSAVSRRCPPPPPCMIIGCPWTWRQQTWRLRKCKRLNLDCVWNFEQMHWIGARHQLPLRHFLGKSVLHWVVWNFEPVVRLPPWPTRCSHVWRGTNKHTNNTNTL